MSVEMVMYDEVEVWKKRSWPIWRHYSGIYPAELRETTRYLSQVRRHTHWDSNPIFLNTSRPFLFWSWMGINTFRRRCAPKSNLSLSVLALNRLVTRFETGHPCPTAYCTGLTHLYLKFRAPVSSPRNDLSVPIECAVPRSYAGREGKLTKEILTGTESTTVSSSFIAH